MSKGYKQQPFEFTFIKTRILVKAAVTVKWDVLDSNQ